MILGESHNSNRSISKDWSLNPLYQFTVEDGFYTNRPSILVALAYSITDHSRDEILGLMASKREKRRLSTSKREFYRSDDVAYPRVS